MASGFSYTGGPPRCFAFWQEFQKCYAQANHPVQCIPQHEDYVECLHGFKKRAREKAIQNEIAKKLKAEANESRKAAEVGAQGASVGVGLIEKATEGGK